MAYNCMYVLGMLLAMQIRFVGFQHVQSGEHMAAMGVFFLLQVDSVFFFFLMCRILVRMEIRCCSLGGFDEVLENGL